MKKEKKILLGVTGASGMLFVDAFLDVVAGIDVTVHGICSSSGRQVLDLEEGRTPESLPGVRKWFDEKDFAAAPASGSSTYDGMVILPCTTGTLAAVANGFSMNLIHRAADVMLKERRRLLLAVRETPFNKTHLENMMKVHEAGGMIIPPLPAYYFKPQSLAEAARTFGWKLAAELGLDVKEAKHWGEDEHKR